MVRKILFLASNPTDTGRLRLDKEVREIGEALKRSNERAEFQLIQTFAVRVEDLRRSLLDNSPRIVHFAGHDGTGGIVLENDQGQPFQVPDGALATLFSLCAGRIECVILNACYSAGQADAIAEHIPCVIGMNTSVSDDAAIEFAVGFYDALGAGRSIEDAFQFGRNAIALKGIPEHLTPVIRKKPLTAEERQRLEASYSPVPKVHMGVSVMTEDTSTWNRGEDTILRYSIERDIQRIRIEGKMGYVDLFNNGGPIVPLQYLTPTWCAFKWDFPILDFKVLNNQPTTLFLSEVVLEVQESQTDQCPLLTIKKDSQRRQAGSLVLINEGWSDIANITVSFHLFPGELVMPPEVERPFKHSLIILLLKDQAELDMSDAFREEGVDIDSLIELTNGTRDEGVYVIPKPDGSEERLTEAEYDERWGESLADFRDEVGTVVGEISFTRTDDPNREARVLFHAPVYLSNLNRMGIMKPPTFNYDTAFEAEGTEYERRVQISHTLEPGEADRFTVKVAVARSSRHRFRATLRDVTGLAIQSLPIEMNCFVPRFRCNAVEKALSSTQAR
jgi:hypothetical protein